MGCESSESRSPLEASFEMGRLPSLLPFSLLPFLPLWKKGTINSLCATVKPVISETLVANKLAGHSGIDGASPVYSLCVSYIREFMVNYSEETQTYVFTFFVIEMGVESWNQPGQYWLR